MKITIKQLKQVETIEDLQSLGLGRVTYDIGNRGGHVAIYSSDISQNMGIPDHQMTNKVGVYCNYLGGGVRGSLVGSEVFRVGDKRKRRILEELIEACRRAYLFAEEESNMFEDEWNEAATNAARQAGISRAY